MRNIDTIVIHHSATPSTLDTKKSLNSFNNSHKQRFYDAYPKSQKQPLGGTEYPYIAYHYCIDRKGAITKTRQHEFIGYHAGNWDVNKDSLGILLIGNFDIEYPTDAQLNACQGLVQELKKKLSIEKILGHRQVVSYKSCPGKNVTDDYIYSLLDKEIINQKIMKDDKYTKWALGNGICNNMNWDEAPTKYETIVMLYRANQPKTFKEEIIEHGTSALVNIGTVALLTLGLTELSGMSIQAALVTAISSVFVLQAGSKQTLDTIINSVIKKFKK
jgi:hypothetical protein